MKNPIGIRVGPCMLPETLLDILKQLERRQNNQIIISTQFGIRSVGQLLPQVLDAVHKTGISVRWMCEPDWAKDGVEELVNAFKLHREYSSVLSGVNFQNYLLHKTNSGIPSDEVFRVLSTIVEHIVYQKEKNSNTEHSMRLLRYLRDED